MKRFIAIILVIALMVSMSASFAACSNQIGTLEMGAWLSLIAESFGMSEYTSEDPYFAQVNKDDPYFGAFQLAAEWEILNPDSNISSSTNVTWKNVLVTLTNAGNFLSADASEDDKIAYAIEHFDPNIRTYWMNRNIKMSEAVALLDTAAHQWVNKVFTERIEERSFTENVADLTEEESVDYEIEGNVVKIDSSLVKDLKAGDVYTLPGIEGSTGSSINQIESIEIDGDIATIVNDQNFDVTDAFANIEEIREQSTEMIDFSQIGAIYDAYGNVLYSSENGINYEIADVSYDGEDNYYVTNLANRGTDTPEASQLGLFKGGSLSFKVDDVKIKVGISGSGISVTLSQETWKKQNTLRSAKQTMFVSGAIKSLQLTKDIDYSWGKLRSAMVKLDYTTTITGGVKGESEAKVGTPLDGDEYKTVRSLGTVIAGYKNAVSSLGKDIRNNNLSKEIYICRIAIPCLSTGICGVDFIVKGKVSVSGQLQVQVTMEGARGVEYKNGNVRFIKEMSKSLEVAAEAEAELTLAAGLELAILTYTAVQVTAEAGVGGKITYTAHVVDAEFHLINSGPMAVSAAVAGAMEFTEMLTSSEDILSLAEAEGGTWTSYVPGAPVVLSVKSCVDWKIYPVLRINASVPFLKSNPGGSIEISGSKNEKFIIKGHIHFPNNLADALSSGSVGKGFLEAIGYGKECDYVFTPWDQDQSIEIPVEETEANSNSEGIAIKDVITTTSQRLFMEMGESKYITISGLPAGYTLNDIQVKSSNEAIATVTNKGKVTAGDKDGTADIIISTSDGKYSTTVAVTVNPKAADSFVGLGDLV